MINPINQETVSIRGIVPGEYVVNLHLYRAAGAGPVPATVKVEKLNPSVQLVFYGPVALTEQGDERTAVRFLVGGDGRVIDVNQLPKSIVPLRRLAAGCCGGRFMTAAIVGLAACYLVLAVLLLSLNLRSAWRWPIKAWAIAITIAFLAAGYLALEAMLGWPAEALTSRPLPAAWRARSRTRSGWPVLGRDLSVAVAADADGAASAPPRAYALPYSRGLHEQIARLQGRLQQGEPVNGTTTRHPGAYRLGTRSVQVELYAAPPPVLPPKTG